MNIGTALILIAVGVFFYLKPNVFKIVMKITGGSILLGVLGGGGYYLYIKYKDSHPLAFLLPKTKQTQYLGLSLGMKRVDVTVKMGSEPDVVSDSGDMIYWTVPTTAADATPEPRVSVMFHKDGVSTICNSDKLSSDAVFDIATGDQEDKMIHQLGPEVHVSIAADGLRKTVSYPDLQVAFEVSGGHVKEICVTDHTLVYINQYDPDAKAKAEAAQKEADQKAAQAKLEQERWIHKVDSEAKQRAEAERSAAEASAARKQRNLVATANEYCTARDSVCDAAQKSAWEAIRKQATDFCWKRSGLDRYTASDILISDCVQKRTAELLH